jgi:acetylornithine deacetylase/succinyl-diaminopimelate desuccinylase family protein
MEGGNVATAVPPDAQERVTRLLCELVAIPSFGGQEARVIGHLAARFRRQGIAFRVTEVDGKPLNIVAEIGEGPRTFLLNSHVDTVPPGDPALWATDPLTPVQKNGKIYGRGAEDAKGCLAAMIVAFEALAARRHALPARVVLMAVGGEEWGGAGTQAELAKGFRADAAIIGESTDLTPKLAHKGVLRLEVEVTGKAAHASEPDAGINAIGAMAPIVSALDRLAGEMRQREDPRVGRASLVISTITGGVALNVIPAQCVITVDRRVLPTETETGALNEILAVATRALPAESGATVAVRTVRFVPPSSTDPNAKIVRAAEQASSHVLGRSVRAGGFTATCDMTFLVNQGHIPTVILGPGSINVAHQVNEYVPVDQLTLAVQVYLETLDAWLKCPSDAGFLDQPAPHGRRP